MDPASSTVCCNCGHPRWSEPSSPIFRRSVKRKAEVHGRDAILLADGFARVEAENELAALRETVASQRGAIQELSLELEEERNAAATAASETMAMILRLQREKADIQMEARQFRRFAEEKMAHDVRQIAELDDLLFRREQEAEALSWESRAFRHRLLEVGADVEVDPISLDFDGDGGGFNLPRVVHYPPLRCSFAESCDDETVDLEQRIYELEKIPNVTSVNIIDASSGHLRRLSAEVNLVPQESSTIADGNEKEDDDETDRIYTIDAVHGVTLGDVSMGDELIKSWRNDQNDQKERFDGGEREDGDIKKLYTRLQALEADRESMRQAIISMKTEKAQLVLLKEIAQQLCKDGKSEVRVVKKKPALFAAFSFGSLIKWVIPFIFWRKKPSRSRYTFGQSNFNVGLMQVLDKSSQMVHWRCLTRVTLREAEESKLPSS